MPNTTTNVLGTITISKEVIASIAGIAAAECYGIVGMANQNIQEGFFQLIGVDSVSKGIAVNLADNKVSIDIHIVVGYGTNINTVSNNIIENVRYRVEKLTGINIEKINIIVQGVALID